MKYSSVAEGEKASGGGTPVCVCEVEWTTVKGMAPIYSGLSSYVGLERHYIWHACVVSLACIPPLVSLMGCTMDRCNLFGWPLVGIYFM